MRINIAGRVLAIHPVWLLITLTAFAILIKLAHWQWQRAAEKTTQLQQLSVMQQQGPLRFAQVLQLPPAEADGAIVQDTGRWLAPYIWLLDNRIVEGKVGYDVVIPVQFAAESTLLLVNLGWVRAPQSRSELPDIDIPEQINIDGLLRSEVGGLRLGQNTDGSGWPLRIQQIELAELQKALPVTLYHAMVYQQHGSDFIPHYQAVVMPPEKHRGYAFQWFMLGLAVLAVALAASYQAGKNDE
jgi:cytochrome oxidase assembly protein ShyY1